MAAAATIAAMDTLLDRRPLLVFAVLLVPVALVLILLLGGGQITTILSTVGASVTGGDSGSSTGGSGSSTGGTSGSEPKATPAPNANLAVAPAPGLLIVRTGTLRLQTGAIATTVQRVTDLVAAAGGYIEGSKESGSGSDGAATIDVRIPSPAWDRTLGALRDLGTVLGQEIGAEEVTGQVVDLDARIANLRTTEAALQAIMAKATRIADVLDVQHELTDTRGQIEELTGQVQTLRDRASFGSLSIVLSLPAAPATPAPSASPPPGWDPGRDVDAASGQLVSIGQTATSAGIWLAIVAIPVLVAIGIGIGLLRLGWLGLRRVGLVGDREPA
jgi:uncharacterized protein DUF4349